MILLIAVVITIPCFVRSVFLWWINNTLSRTYLLLLLSIFKMGAELGQAIAQRFCSIDNILIWGKNFSSFYPSHSYFLSHFQDITYLHIRLGTVHFIYQVMVFDANKILVFAQQRLQQKKCTENHSQIFIRSAYKAQKHSPHADESIPHTACSSTSLCLGCMIKK